MNHQEQQEVLSPSTLPVLSRLDRLDTLLLLLEDRLCLSTKQSSSSVIGRMKSTEDQCKTLNSALEEANHKGTIMERLTMLENRVLELSMVMEGIEYTSRSSSSTNQVAEKIEHKSSFTAFEGQDEDTMNNLQGTTNLGESSERKSKSYQKERRWRNVALLRHKKWLGWFRMGC